MAEKTKGNGYMGKYLRINLTQQKIKEESFDQKTLRNYIGGRGLGIRMLYDELPKDLRDFDPLSEKNKVIIMTGPYTGTPAPASARFDVITLSPHTGFIGAANSGGFFGPALKKSGFDGVIIEGKSSDPVYLSCIEGKFEMRDARKMWGQDTYKTEDLIREDLDNKRVRIASIGPAGERGVTFSALMCDKGRAAARTGAGAVLGAKKFKGIAVQGSKKVEVAFSEEFKEKSRYFTNALKKDPMMQAFQLNGTNMALLLQMEVGDVPISNYSRGIFDTANKITSRAQWESVLVDHHACMGCVISCKRKVEIKKGKYKLEENPASGVEYEGIAAFGTNLEIDNIFAITKANDYCNRMGMDIISAGSVVAYAMECFEKGLITEDELDGLQIRFGDPDSLLAMLKLIAERRKIGHLLSTGTKRSAEEIEGSKNLAVHVKGLEVAMHDPRANFGLALHYSTNPYGGHHTSGGDIIIAGMASLPNKDLGLPADDIRNLDRFSPVGKAMTIKTIQDRLFVVDSMGLCAFINQSTMSVPKRYPSAMLALVTGWKMNYYKQFLKTGERIANLFHAFNLRCGLTFKDFHLPYRLMKESHPDGGAKDIRINLPPMLRDYFKLRDWDMKTCKPSPEKLKELGLDDVAKDVHG